MPPSRSTSRPSSSRSTNDSTGRAQIDKLDYHPGGRPLLDPHAPSPNSAEPFHAPSYAGSFFDTVASGIASHDRARKSRQVQRYLAFAWAVFACLCAGSITAYSLYAPLFQRRLRYSQLRVNGVSIAAELAMYLSVPLWGYLCDRFGPGRPSALAGVLFGAGYLLAAFAYASGPPRDGGGDGWPYAVMVLAFVGVGMGTSCMYLSAVTTCAKNFGRGRWRGFALSLPIASFGLSGMWQSQIGSRLLCETAPDGSRGEVDVRRYFLFLGCLLLVVGFVGFFALQVVDEEDMIDEAVEELEQSSLLEDSEYFQRAQHADGYGTIPNSSQHPTSPSPSSSEDPKRRSSRDARKKTWLLDQETRAFLADHTMWWLAAGFFLATGPGEAFINNLGTIIGTLYPPRPAPGETPTSAATHVSIVAVASTLARILTGTLSDLFAPASGPHHHRRGPHSLANSLASLPDAEPAKPSFSISRVIFLLAFSLLLSAGQVLLASGALHAHGERFWLVSASIGAGYGAVFSLTPIIVSVVWGVQNFGTNWGIVATVPAAGATLWGLVYSGVYEGARGRRAEQGGRDGLCYGVSCYAPTFWAMAGSVWLACGLWVWAWRGPDGWRRRGIAV